MRWNAEDFFTHIASKHSVCLIGWPSYLDFTNLSNVPGGIRVMWDLAYRILIGSLAFVELAPGECEGLTVEKAAPGKYVLRQPRRVRRDYGKQRVLPWLRRSRPPRRICMGPKSAEYVAVD